MKKATGSHVIRPKKITLSNPKLKKWKIPGHDQEAAPGRKYKIPGHDEECRPGNPYHIPGRDEEAKGY